MLIVNTRLIKTSETLASLSKIEEVIECKTSMQMMILIHCQDWNGH